MVLGTQEVLNNGSCCSSSSRKVSVNISQNRLDTTWLPARMGMHKFPRLVHVQVHLHIDLPMHLRVPRALKSIHCVRRLHAHGVSGTSTVLANKITGPLLLITGEEEMLFQFSTPACSSLGSFQLRAAGNSGFFPALA